MKINPILWPKQNAVLRYGISVVSVLAALFILLWMQTTLYSIAHVSVFICAVMLSAWFGGTGPGLLAIALSDVAFNYFFLPPVFELGIKNSELPRNLLFTMAALFVVVLSATQRSAVKSLKIVRDELEKSNEILQTENDERIKTEESLRQSESDLAEAQRVARLGSWYFDTTTNSVRWSEELYRIFDLEKSTFGVTYESFLSKVHPDDRPKVVQTNTNARSNGEPFELEYRIVSQNGQQKNIREIGHVKKDGEGNVIGLFGIAQDITERNLFKENLEHSHSLLDAAIESTADGLLVVDNNGRITKYNRKFIELWSIPQSILATNNDDIALTYVLEQLETPEDFLSKVKTLYAHPDAESFDVLRFKDGRILERYSQPQRLNDKIVGRVWSFRDATIRSRTEKALKEDEAKLRTIFDILPVGLSIIDGERNITDMNSALENIVGMSKKNIIVGEYKKRRYVRSDGSLIPIDDFPSSRAMKEQRVVKDMEIGIKLENNDTIWTSVSAAPIPINGSGVVVVTTDINERKRSERALHKTQTRLRQLSHRLMEVQENERRMLARELHDEIGQILTAVKIDLEVLRQNELPDNLRIRLNDDIETLDNCLQQVRNLSIDLRPSILDDLGLIAALQWQLNRQKERAGFNTRFNSDELPFRMHTDLETACFRVAQESLTNISRHAKAKNVIVELRITDSGIFLTIHDDGIGFDVDNPFNDVIHGMTFGLLSMQERVNLLGGDLEITSMIGKGTTIKARLPFKLREGKE